MVPFLRLLPGLASSRPTKTRPIDDMSISLVNSSFSPSYRLELAGVDVVAVLALWNAFRLTD